METRARGNVESIFISFIYLPPSASVNIMMIRIFNLVRNDSFRQIKTKRQVFFGVLAFVLLGNQKFSLLRVDHVLSDAEKRWPCSSTRHRNFLDERDSFDLPETWSLWHCFVDYIASQFVVTFVHIVFTSSGRFSWIEITGKYIIFITTEAARHLVWGVKRNFIVASIAYAGPECIERVDLRRVRS